MQEKWMRWKPVEGLATKYYIEGIVANKEGFKITLLSSENKTKVIVAFSNFVEAYRYANETYRLALFEKLNQQNNDPDFYSKWTFFKVENSDFLRWLSKESFTISDTRELQHFSFIDTDAVLDIINPLDPHIELIPRVE